LEKKIVNNKKLFALGRLKIGQKNKTELDYEQEVIIPKQAAGEILWYRFEGLKFRLADNTFYTPDFAVMTSDGQIELHEVKGFWQDDARAKIKIASGMYPFVFVAVMKQKKSAGGGWKIEDF